MSEAEKKLGDQFREKAYQEAASGMSKANAAMLEAAKTLKDEIKQNLEQGKDRIRIKLNQPIKLTRQSLDGMQNLEGYKKIHAVCEEANVSLRREIGSFDSCYIVINLMQEYSGSLHAYCHKPKPKPSAGVITSDGALSV